MACQRTFLLQTLVEFSPKRERDINSGLQSAKSHLTGFRRAGTIFDTPKFESRVSSSLHTFALQILDLTAYKVYRNLWNIFVALTMRVVLESEVVLLGSSLSDTVSASPLGTLRSRNNRGEPPQFAPRSAGKRIAPGRWRNMITIFSTYSERCTKNLCKLLVLWCLWDVG